MAIKHLTSSKAAGVVVTPDWQDLDFTKKNMDKGLVGLSEEALRVAQEGLVNLSPKYLAGAQSVMESVKQSTLASQIASAGLSQEVAFTGETDKAKQQSTPVTLTDEKTPHIS